MNVFKYPLRVRHFEPADLSGDLTSDPMFTAIVLRRVSPYNWECMSCAEAGNRWLGIDHIRHCEDHQMGFDFALSWLRKHRKSV